MKRNKTFNKILIFVFSIVCVAVCVLVAQFFASVLTLGSLEVSSNSGNSFLEFKVYAISLGNYSTKASAETTAVTYRQKNAGGYILKINGTYHIIASAYEKENDAKLVQENLLKEDITSQIIIIGFEEIDLENISSNSQEKEFIDSLGIFKIVYLKLYDISVSLDTNVIDETRAKIEIIELKAEVEERLEKIKRGTTAVDGIYYQIIKNKFNQIIDLLNDLKNYEQSDGIILSSKIKYTYVFVLDIAKDLINALNNEI
jgi:hypothetical protein